jgi:hypothetical protein
MAENDPIPPKPGEPAKVQPKKETVRINLPPKPTSAPTIKLPTLAPGAPPPAMVAAAAAPAAPRAAAPAVPQPPSSGAPASRVAGSAAAQKSGPAAAPRPFPVAIQTGLTTLDKALAIGAAVASVAGLAGVVYLAFFLKDTTGS